MDWLRSHSKVALFRDFYCPRNPPEDPVLSVIARLSETKIRQFCEQIRRLVAGSLWIGSSNFRIEYALQFRDWFYSGM